MDRKIQVAMLTGDSRKTRNIYYKDKDGFQSVWNGETVWLGPDGESESITVYTCFNFGSPLIVTEVIERPSSASGRYPRRSTWKSEDFDGNNETTGHKTARAAMHAIINA